MNVNSYSRKKGDSTCGIMLPAQKRVLNFEERAQRY